MTHGFARLLLPFLLAFLFTSCEPIGVFEKNVIIPKHEWNSSFKPEIKAQIDDTAAFYNVYVVIRHNNAYEYNNIWLELTRKSGSDSLAPQQLNLPLATNEEGWLGSGIDDIFEQRRLVTPEGGMKLAGREQFFKIGHLMRKDPLPNIMNVGIRIEKVNP